MYKKKDTKLPENYPFNTKTQVYKNIRLTLCAYQPNYYDTRNAKRFTLGNPQIEHQKIWIPNTCLLPDGTLKPGIDLDWIFSMPTVQQKLKSAHEINNEFMQKLPYQDRLKELY